MCSNYKPIKRSNNSWVKDHFGCDLPSEPYREETYPNYPAPFIYLDAGQPRCGLALFGLIPHWATERQKFGLKTYNARSETAPEKPSYRNAWKERRFGLVLAESFYEPNWESGKAIRWGIRRSDDQPLAIASIWERFTDRETGEIIFSFSMLTVNADGHDIMKHFHRPEDEKRSVVVLRDHEYLPWLNADTEQAKTMLNVPPVNYLTSSPEPRSAVSQTLSLL